MEHLQERIGYIFRDKQLLSQALTHPSAGGEKHLSHNQRLEFLGDAVLQLIMSERLYTAYPNLQEGALSRLRARSVQEAALHAAALRLNLGSCLRLSHGEVLSGGREKPSILADAMEALLGALYLDGGLEAARRIADAFLPTAPGEMGRDYKTELQEHLQKGGRATPHYTIVSEDGPPHARRFLSEVFWEKTKIGRGEGSSKKAAEQAAAQDALSRVGEIIGNASQTPPR